jgi:histidine triad (HIT) family protein
MALSPETGSCPFCRIVAGTAPARIVYRDEQVTAFHDIHPIARIHLLIVPNRHIVSINELEETDKDLLGHMFLVAQRLASQEGVAESGYRLIVNTGSDAGQSVLHLHLHLIAGKFARFTLH